MKHLFRFLGGLVELVGFSDTEIVASTEEEPEDSFGGEDRDVGGRVVGGFTVVASTLLVFGVSVSATIGFFSSLFDLFSSQAILLDVLSVPVVVVDNC